MGQRRVHYVLSTHWDREWYLTFQDFRHRLVKLLDHVLQGWEDGRLKGPFQTDGQAILVEDYLEVRPEKLEKIKELVKERRLVVGPWYVLPDEFLVSGEALIRNLSLGRKLVRELGGTPSQAGFMCDLFGHNSQMPQILGGFGIRGGFIWRGTNLVETRLVHWRGADGTEMPCYRFGNIGYCDYANQVRHANDPHYPKDLEDVIQDLDSFLEAEDTKTEAGPLLAFDGGDHLGWDVRAYSILQERMSLKDGNFEILHSCLDDYLAEMLPQADNITQVIEGELRDPGYYPPDQDQQWVIPGVLSSRVWIKQENAVCQTLLCHWAEPMTAIAHSALGEMVPQGFLDIAWKWLLQNHPHDSICGCSIDAVHEDMRYRFHQSRSMAERLTQEACRSISRSMTGKVNDNEVRVVVFNPLPQDFEQTTELDLQIPVDWPTFNESFGYEPKPAFRIYDFQGQEITYQRLGQSMGRIKARYFSSNFPSSYRVNVVRVSLPIKVPALGYTTLTLRSGESGKPTRHPEVPGLAKSERSMANEFISVTIESNGTLTLTERRTGQVYHDLLALEDRADIGDGWYFGMAANDQYFYSSACQASIALVHNGPYLTTFRIRTTMPLPAEFDFSSMRRSEKLADLVVDHLVSLRPGSDYLEIETRVQNKVKDHRLRVLFPSGALASTFFSDTPFDVVERPIALRKDNHLYRELEMETRPQQSWSAIYGGERGLALISTGLMEISAIDMPDRPLALTLFRSTRRTVMTDGEPLGQLQGDLSFRYYLAPLSESPDRTRLFLLGQKLAAGLRDIHIAPDDLLENTKTERRLPLEASFLRVIGKAVVTSVRHITEALEVRCFNPENDSVQATIELPSPFWSDGDQLRAEMVNFESNPLDAIDGLDGKTLRLTLNPKQIATIRIVQ